MNSLLTISLPSDNFEYFYKFYVASQLFCKLLQIKSNRENTKRRIFVSPNSCVQESISIRILIRFRSKYSNTDRQIILPIKFHVHEIPLIHLFYLNNCNLIENKSGRRSLFLISPLFELYNLNFSQTQNNERICTSSIRIAKVVDGKKTDIPREWTASSSCWNELLEAKGFRIKQREGGVIVACVIIYCAVVVPRGWNLISPYNRKLVSLSFVSIMDYEKANSTD